MNAEQEPAARAGGDVDIPAAPIRLVVEDDDLRRSRVTVFFRLLLVIPHAVVFALWSGLAYVFALINWFAILFTGRPVSGLHELQVHYLRYFSHVDSYFTLLAEPFPGFGGEPGSYPIALEVPDAHPQNRWKTAFRLVLALPALMLGGAMGAGGVFAGGGTVRVSLGVIGAAAFLGWFASLVRGSLPQGLRDLLAYAISYSAQATGYLLLVTDRYPNADPLAVQYARPAPDHPIRITAHDDLRRSRLTVFFRLFLFLPHLIWLMLWGIAALFAALANWFVTLFSGRSAPPLHRFLSAYLRYGIHVSAFLYLVANPFPGFTGEPSSYPVDVTIAPPERQNRWKTGFRLILAFPATMVVSVLSNALTLVALFSWFTGLILGRVPPGLQHLGVFALRYQAQVNAYVFLLTDRYPFSGPSLELPRD